MIQAKGEFEQCEECPHARLSVVELTHRVIAKNHPQSDEYKVAMRLLEMLIMYGTMKTVDEQLPLIAGVV